MVAQMEPSADLDLGIVTKQLGRTPRGFMGVAARCRFRHPCVIRTSPRLPDGNPFPTFYYLTCPAGVAACSRLEAAGVMREAEAMLHNPDFADFQAAYRRAHELYLADRAASIPAGQVPEIAGFSAGGMPDRVKCFHALVGHALAAGPGVNPVGDWVLARLREENLWSPESCTWSETE